MASLTIRNLDDALKQRLRMRAAKHARSMEEEAREILRSSLPVDEEVPNDLVQAIAQRFQPLGGVELELPDRNSSRSPPQR